MAIDPRIAMMGAETPYESPFDTQTNALALQQQRGAGQMADAKRALDMFKMGRQVLASSVDESTYQRGLAALRQAGIPTDDMPPNFDPEYVRSEGMALLDAEDRYKQQLFQQDNRLLSASPYTGKVDVIYEGPEAPPKPAAMPAPMSEYQRRMLELREQELGARDTGMTEYQRRMLDLRKRELDARKTKARGAGSAGVNKTSEQERNTAYNAGRLLRAAQDIQNAVARSPSAETPGLLESAAGAIPLIGGSLANVTRSADRQIVTSAQSDMLDALLYLATGAAYNKEQKEANYDAYVPRFTDKEETVKNKRDKLRSVIDKARNRSGNAWTPEMEASFDLLMAGQPAATSVAPAAAAPSAPEGVDADVWAVMTPEERALWQK